MTLRLRPLVLLALRLLAVWIAIQAHLAGAAILTSIYYGLKPAVLIPVCLHLIHALLWAAITAVLIGCIERLAPMRGGVREVFFAALFVMLAAVAGAIGQALVLNGALPEPRALFTRVLAPNLSIALFAIVIAYLFAGREEAADRERARLELDALLSRTQAEEFRARLAPRFLFTTLDTIRDLIRTDPRRADRTLMRLGELLRTVMEFNRARDVSLEQELELIDRYLSVHAAPTMLRLHADDEAMRVRVPPFLLHPIVEQLAEGGATSVTIDAFVDEQLEVRVRGANAIETVFHVPLTETP
ncbi:MAG TPA: histidine kinase [Thermoanaerobaculia bacterium]|nr:histidine kinase [Thermoanaerobaculia bacterium]